MPSAKLGRELRPIVERLTDEHQAAVFETHATVYSGPSSDEESRAALAAVAPEFAPIELAFDGVRHSPLFTKTLFVQFQPSKELRRMFRAVKKQMARHSYYRSNPHLSLLYKDFGKDTAVREKLCARTEAPRGTYIFDVLRVVKVHVPITRAEQIAEWQVVAEKPLGAQPA